MALAFLAFMILVSLSANFLASSSDGWLSTFDKMEISPMSKAFSPPHTILSDGRVHWLGTDQIGRDVLSRLIHSLSTALIIGFVSTLIAYVISLLLGGLAGYFQNDFKVSAMGLVLFSILSVFVAFQCFYLLPSYMGSVLCIIYLSSLVFMAKWLLTMQFGPFIKIPIDNLIIKLMEVKRSIPGIMLFIVLLAIIGRVSIWQLSVLIGLLTWSTMTRVCRAQFIKFKEEDFSLAAQIMGLSGWRIAYHHILPNVIRPLSVLASINVGNAILLESSLSFLQLGLSSDMVSLGAMIAQSRSYLSAWWLVIPPGILIFSLIFTANVIGEGLKVED